MPIQLLDPQVISRIAAGEVIERPASVVKELVENALDAGATQISVEIQGGGLELIRVSDNGCGIPPADLELAFQRHATSKIMRFEDMFSLHSLGFRGEALPSIAAVAEVEITSCPANATEGGRLHMRDGKTLKKSALGRAPGTTISAVRLFQSVPARLKFLKSRPTEAAHIANVISQYALAYPEVKFSLVMDSKSSLTTPGSGKLSDAIIQVYGLEVARNMLDIGGQGWNADAAIKVSGMVSSPAISRSTGNYVSLFVNRRWITSRRLTYAVEEAYHGLLMTGKHPIAVINIEVAPTDVDVNIHPTKSEVKFKDESAVFGAVQRAVRQALVNMTPVSSIAEVSAPYQTTKQSALFSHHPPTTRQPVAEPLKSSASSETQPLATPKVTLPALRLLGQIRNSYIVAEGPDGLYLIDQHAAHERILFEKLSREKTLDKLEVQALLSPEPFDVTPAQASILAQHVDDLAEMGFLLESFGTSTYLARTVPAMLADKNWKAMLSELLESGDRERSQFMERLMALTACHSAVRFGQTLGEDEMREMLRQLEQVDLPNSCPHGRPTLICLTHEQLGKEFKRS
ncbi:MAG: DNA mismatch repair endonuclease MutL [Dehalococcoidia bacterium]|nr:MAG: DNA mismatch repair endonuclease MutL [Dehalococcoidia bacterium]